MGGQERENPSLLATIPSPWQEVIPEATPLTGEHYGTVLRQIEARMVGDTDNNR